MNRIGTEQPSLAQLERELQHIQRQKRRGKRIWNAVCTIFLIPIVLLAVALVGVRLVGLTPYTILSGSMTPEYKVGDLVYVQDKPIAEIKAGDVISFVNDEALRVVTHRVAQVDEENRCFRTKGDANENIDGKAVLFENVLGVVVFSIPKLGYLSSYVTSPAGRYVAIATVLVLVLVLFILPELLKTEPPKKRK